MTTTLDTQTTPVLYETKLVTHHHVGLGEKNNHLKKLNAEGWRVVSCCRNGPFVGGMILVMERPASMNTDPPEPAKKRGWF